METTLPTLVIARHTEDISWASTYPHVVIQKDEDMPNIGREPSSFFYFILTNYHKLKGEYVFLQGNPFDHAPEVFKYDFGRKLVSSASGSPHHPGLDIHPVCHALGLPIQDEYPFFAGGQFKVTAEQIRERTWDWYACALYLSTQGQNPWVFERLWETIYAS